MTNTEHTAPEVDERHLRALDVAAPDPEITPIADSLRAHQMLIRQRVHAQLDREVV